MDYEFFSERELSCKCPRVHPVNPMDPGFMEKLVEMRRFLGFPLPLSSAYRCPLHNQEVSNTGPNGPHTTGRAVDARVYGQRAFALVAAAPTFGLTGIGVHQRGKVESRFIHIDDLTEMPHPRPWVWSY